MGIIKNAKKFQTIYEVASELVDDVVLRITKDGMFIRAIDSAHVAFLLVDLPRAFFSKFRTNEELEWNVAIADVTKILRRAKSSDILEISHSEDDDHYLVFKVITGKRQRTFRLAQKDAVAGSIPQEVIDDGRRLEDVLNEFEKKVREACLGQFVLETDFLEDLVKDAQIVSDLMMVDIIPEKDLLRFSAVEIGATNSTDLSLKEREHVLSARVLSACHGMYALNYLENVLKLKAVVESYSLSLGNNAPLLLEAKFLKDEETLQIGDPGSIRFILAPRVEDMGTENTDTEADDKAVTEESAGENEIAKAKKSRKPGTGKKPKGKPAKASKEDTIAALDTEAEEDSDLDQEQVDQELMKGA